MKRRERVGDVEVAFDDDGAGPALVLLHPFPFNRRIWAENIPPVIAAGRRVIAVDYPGCGDSPAPSRPLSLADLADLVEALLDRLAIETVTLVGLSMGGYVALAFAQRFPRRLAALVLADTQAGADGATAREGRTTALATIREQGVEKYLDQSLPRLLAPDAPADLLARTLALAEKRPETLAAGIAALRDRPDRTAELAGLLCPTLVLVGQTDQVTPAAGMRAMSGTIPNSRFVEIPTVGHLSNLEAPTAFNRALTDFLRAHPGTTPGAPNAAGRPG